MIERTKKSYVLEIIGRKNLLSNEQLECIKKIRRKN